jgi:hypothetical protein
VLRCTVASNAAVGGIITVGIAPQSVQATSNGAPVTVTQGMMSNGMAGSNSAAISVAPMGTQASSPGTPSTPGVPNTGAGGDAMMTWTLLILSALIAISGATVALRKQ